jgi:hypothetical protein
MKSKSKDALFSKNGEEDYKVRKATVEYPHYNKEENEYEKYVPNTSPRKLVSESKANSSIGTTSTYKTKDLRKDFHYIIAV